MNAIYLSWGTISLSIGADSANVFGTSGPYFQRLLVPVKLHFYELTGHEVIFQSISAQLCTIEGATIAEAVNKPFVYPQTIEVKPDQRRKGHFNRLLEQLWSCGFTVKVPNPLRNMEQILRKMGFYDISEQSLTTSETKQETGHSSLVSRERASRAWRYTPREVGGSKWYVQTRSRPTMLPKATFGAKGRLC
jgi:hypothetical protein